MEWNRLLSKRRMRGNYGNTVHRSADLRSEFEKDYHRIIGSASFRRLQDKTQVFPLDKSDFIHKADPFIGSLFFREIIGTEYW